MTSGMIDFDIRERQTFEKTNFLDLDYGMHVVRLIEKPTVIFTHYVPSKGSFRCLGEDCPVCKNNDGLRREHGSEAYKMPGWNSAQERHYVNILDRTMVKVCPNCGNEVKKNIMFQYPPQCPKCNTFVTEVVETVSNKVKMVNLSPKVIKQLAEYQKNILDENKEPLGIMNFDVVLMVTKQVDKSGKEKKDIVALPKDPIDKTEINFDELEEFKYDPFNSVINLTVEEVISLLSGVSMKDIFTARKASKPEATELPKNVAEVESAINELFADNPPF